MAIFLVKPTPQALEIDHLALTNRVGRGHICPLGMNGAVRGAYTRRRPPDPPPNPPERRSGRLPPARGRASFTFRVRPMSSVPWRPVIAACASDAEGISTKPKPFDCPLYWSLMRRTDVTAPKGLKARPQIGLGHVRGQVPHINSHACLPCDPRVASSRPCRVPALHPHARVPGSAAA
jgi:hypothetical protein